MSTDPIAINYDEGDEAPEQAAVETRRNLSMLLTAGVADGLGARAGFRPGGSDPITLSGQTVEVHPRPVTVYPGESSTDGPYIGHLVADTHSLDPADGSNPRIDIVVVRVYDDDHDASGRRELVTEYITGTPAADPDPPSTPVGAVLAATVAVPAGGSPSPTLDFVGPFTVAAGGVLPVRDADELPTAGRYAGMAAYRQDVDQMVVWNGSTWGALGPATAEDANTERVDIADSEGNKDLGVSVPITVGPLGIVIVTQALSWEADTANDSRTCDLRAFWTGANSGSTDDDRLRRRSVTLRQASGERDSHTFMRFGLTPGSTTFTQTASISTDDLIVYRSFLRVVTF